MSSSGFVLLSSTVIQVHIKLFAILLQIFSNPQIAQEHISYWSGIAWIRASLGMTAWGQRLMSFVQQLGFWWVRSKFSERISPGTFSGARTGFQHASHFCRALRPLTDFSYGRRKYLLSPGLHPNQLRSGRLRLIYVVRTRFGTRCVCKSTTLWIWTVHTLYIESIGSSWGAGLHM